MGLMAKMRGVLSAAVYVSIVDVLLKAATCCTSDASLIRGGHVRYVYTQPRAGKGLSRARQCHGLSTRAPKHQATNHST